MIFPYNYVFQLVAGIVAPPLSMWSQCVKRYLEEILSLEYTKGRPPDNPLGRRPSRTQYHLALFVSTPSNVCAHCVGVRSKSGGANLVVMEEQLVAETDLVIVVPGDDPVQIANSPQLDRLRTLGEVRVFHDRPATVEEQVRRARDAHVLINSRGQVHWRDEALCQLPNLKMIALCSIGTDSIDLESTRDRDIVVSNIPGKTAPVVAEHAFSLMLAVSRRLAFQTAELKAGRWTRAANIYLAGKTIGVLGTGAIGREMIRLCQALGMRVLAWTFHPTAKRADELGVTFVERDVLFSQSDVVSLHLKLTEQTEKMIGRAELAQMKPGALLVNTARGGVIDRDALVEALKSGHLAGAGLDVFETEPLPADDPLLACEQVVLTPHNADQTPEGVELLNAGAVDNVLAFLQGAPQNVVT